MKSKWTQTIPEKSGRYWASHTSGNGEPESPVLVDVFEGKYRTIDPGTYLSWFSVPKGTWFIGLYQPPLPETAFAKWWCSKPEHHTVAPESGRVIGGVLITRQDAKAMWKELKE